MSDNIITSDDTNPKPAKKQAAAKTTVKAKKVAEVKMDSDGCKYVYFSSGASYTTPDGYVFTRDNPIHLLPLDLADHLLGIDNFRLPDQIELEEYLNKS